MNLTVDLSILGPRKAGVTLYALAMARYLEQKKSAKIICPEHWSGYFTNPSICHNPIKYKNTVICRNPRWSQRLTRDTLLYSPHDRLACSINNQIITLHDLIPYIYPGRNPIEWVYYRFFLPSRIKKITALFTVSETSKKDIIARFGLRSEKVHVVPNGIDLDVWSKGHQPDNKQPYLLCVSANRPYKNTVDFIDHHPLWANKFKLKILGSRARYGLKIRALIAHYGLSESVEFLDDLSTYDVIRLYRHASALIYPSLAEGFGRPPLEAMAIGCPVILSDIPVHLENFADAGIFISPRSTESWRYSISQLFNDKFIKQRQSLGYLVAEKFSLQKATSLLENALNKIHHLQIKN